MKEETEQEAIMVRGYPVYPFINLFGHHRYKTLLGDGDSVFGGSLEEIEKKLMEAEDTALKGLMLPNPDPGMPEPNQTPCRASSQPEGGSTMTEHTIPLRDYIAIHASEADIDNHLVEGRVINPDRQEAWQDEPVYLYPTRELARYRYADEMLKARGSVE